MPLPNSIDTSDVATFEAIYRALVESSQSITGPLGSRLVVLPIHDDTGAVVGGLWGHTLFRWLSIEMLVVPEPMRNRGIGSALVILAENEALARGCIGAYVDAFSFQAAPFYHKLGFSVFGVLENFPLGHNRLYFSKRFASAKAARPPL